MHADKRPVEAAISRQASSKPAEAYSSIILVSTVFEAWLRGGFFKFIRRVLLSYAVVVFDG